MFSLKTRATCPGKAGPRSAPRTGRDVPAHTDGERASDLDGRQLAQSTTKSLDRPRLESCLC